MFSYLQFLLKSTNQHGVHSPFVFNYITKGLYKQNDFKHIPHKTNQWLLQSVSYFKPETICFLNEELSVLSSMLPHHKKTEFPSADLIIDRYTPENQPRIKQTIKNMNNSQLLLLACHKYSRSFLNELRKNTEITLVVDFYYGCLISKRTEQLKQNFFIRY